VDGGFGRTGALSTGYGNGTFNTPPLVEAADKRTFFHNNFCSTIECAVEFYNSVAFNSSPSGEITPISLRQEEVFRVAAFLRAINALENIRAATAKLENAQSSIDSHTLSPPRLQKLLGLATADIQDADRVLGEGRDPQFKPGGLHPEARTLLAYAKDNCEIAYKGGSKAERNYRISEALNALAAAKRGIVNP
jgi:hypothetical protein